MNLQQRRGFTIIELMIVIVIVAIVATFALPSLRELVVRARLRTAAGDLHTSLMLARSEAIKRNGAVTVSPLGGGTDWAVGWEVKAGAAVLSTQDPYAGVSFTTTDASYTATPISSVSFASTGRATPSAGTRVAFVLIATGSSAPARCVVLDPSGRPTVRTDQDNDPSDGCN
jgi:type IV fimbrial biogenesis protein FimT